MAGLLGGVLQNSRALAAHTAGVETAGRNLANVNNPAYARQSVILGNVGHAQTDLGTQSFGVEALSIRSLRDAVLEAQLTREVSDRASLEAQAQVYQWIEDNLGEGVDRAIGPDESGAQGISPAGLARAMDDFFNAVMDLSNAPTDEGKRQVLLQRADVLTDRFNTVDRRMSAIDDNINVQIDAEIGRAQQILQDIADLNNRIARFEIRTPEGAVDLRDERLAKVNDLAEIMNFEVEQIPDSAGQIRLRTTDTSGNPFVLLEYDRIPAANLAYDGTNYTAGGGPADLNITAGTLHGYRETTNGLLGSLRTDLDALAEQITTAVNTAYNPLGTAGENFFTGTTAGTIQRDPALDMNSIKTADSGLAGDNTLLLAVAALQDQTFSTTGTDVIDGTFSEFYHRAVTEVGEAANSSSQRLENQELVENLLRTQRDSISGVSMDEEVADLMRFQRAFQGTARVVQTMDTLLDTVINRLG